MDALQILHDAYGPLMHSRDVQAALRYRTAGGFRAARNQGKLKLEMFAVQGRRGLFAKTESVAELLQCMAMQGQKTPSANPREGAM